jgi:hypothetical protein
MSELFTIGDETTHVKGDAQCPEWPLTRCDRCGRSEEELD